MKSITKMPSSAKSLHNLTGIDIFLIFFLFKIDYKFLGLKDIFPRYLHCIIMK